MIRRIIAHFQTPVFANTGSTARDHLASERTFLAWTRTGLGFIALGIAIERFSQLNVPSSTQDAGGELGSEPYAVSQTQKTNVTAGSRGPSNSHALEPEALLVPSLMGIGTGSIVYGTSRYFTNLRLIERGSFMPAYNGVAVLSVSCAALAGAAYWGMVQREQEKAQLPLSNPKHSTHRLSNIKRH